MILVDTSAWIDYLRAEDSPAAHELTRLIQQGAGLVTTEPVVMELLAGADTPRRADVLERLTNGLPSLALDPREDFRQAASVFPQARRRGRTVRSLVDCLIAAVALRHDVALLHRDADYDVIAGCLPLRIHRAPAT
ncbi:MAG: type II toxin-antitoxin system VapC family toxin [Jiangellaceae bacterium]